MTAHLLHLDEVDEGEAIWRFTCHHDEDDPAWIYRLPDGTPDPTNLGDCWLESWWDAEGGELLDLRGPIMTFPVPVGPSDDWDYDNGGSITLADSPAANAGAVVAHVDAVLVTATPRRPWQP